MYNMYTEHSYSASSVFRSELERHVYKRANNFISVHFRIFFKRFSLLSSIENLIQCDLIYACMAYLVVFPYPKVDYKS